MGFAVHFQHAMCLVENKTNVFIKLFTKSPLDALRATTFDNKKRNLRKKFNEITYLSDINYSPSLK